MPRSLVPRTLRVLLLGAGTLLAPTLPFAAAADGLTPAHVASLRAVREVRISPSGDLAAYTLSVPRIPGVDEDGAPWSELHVVPLAGGASRPFVCGEVNASGIRFHPSGRWITYLARRGADEDAALWAIPVDGGESRRLLAFEGGVGSYRLSPDGTRVAFLGREPVGKEREAARTKGFRQEVFEEDGRPGRVWIAPLPSLEPTPAAPWDGAFVAASPAAAPRALRLDGSVHALEWSPDGGRLVLAVTPRNLVDDEYMKSRLHVVDVETGALLAEIRNEGKHGAFAMGPDGTRVALLSGADLHDPAPGRLCVAPAAGGTPRDVMPDLEGHVRALAWQDGHTLMFLADVGVGTVFGEVDVENGARKIHHTAGTFEAPAGPLLSALELSRDGQRAVFAGESAAHPSEVFAMQHGEAEPRRLTDSNPWLADVPLARQEVVRYAARDGLEIEGLLIHPLVRDGEGPVPLLLSVHGGPESNVRHGWITSYSRPGQVAAARGYAVFYPNYRGSTGRGVAFSKLSQGDEAGREFDDLIDGVDHLVAAGLVDRDRVGVTGGSYGGYATAWLSTFYTDRIRAGVMFVGISNVLTKSFTTDIPFENEAVHTLSPPWTNWELRLERSPLYHAEKSRTALLIAGGTADTRVNPEQSLQLFRALDMLGHTPVRYVRYPDEPHGNRRAASRYDYHLRMLRWFDHYLLGEGGEPPPWDLKLGERAVVEGDGD